MLWLLYDGWKYGQFWNEPFISVTIKFLNYKRHGCLFLSVWSEDLARNVYNEENALAYCLGWRKCLKQVFRKGPMRFFFKIICHMKNILILKFEYFKQEVDFKTIRISFKKIKKLFSYQTYCQSVTNYAINVLTCFIFIKTQKKKKNDAMAQIYVAER